MNFEQPFGYYLTLAFNGLNFLLGIITAADFNMLSALIGLTMNLMYFLVKMYRLIGKPYAKDAEFEAETLKRTCVHCKNVFETDSPTQIFCSPECREAFNENAHSRRP